MSTMGLTGYPELAAVIFDWGGTLTPWDDSPWEPRWRGGAELLYPADPDKGAEILADAEQDLWRAAARTGHIGSICDVPWQAASRLGVSPSARVVAEILARHFTFMEPVARVRPEARPTISALKERGLAIGVLTVSHWPVTWHEELFRRDGLADLVDVRCYGGEERRPKPHPEGFLTTLAQLGVAPAAAVYVGDAVRSDIAGAQAVGMRAIWLPNGTMSADGAVPDATISALPEVVDVVAGWQAGQATP